MQGLRTDAGSELDVDHGGFDPDYYLRERYATQGIARLAGLYYLVKPLLPRSVQIKLRRRHAARRAEREFPRWPIEDLLVRDQEASFRRAIAAAGGDSVPFVNFWPSGHRFAYVLTHDVEGPAGIANIERVRKVERAHGVVSSWNFVAEDYPIPDGLFEKLRADGCEIGLHGIHHDRKLWRDEKTFERTLPKIHRYLADWQAVGWRSPVTYRNAGLDAAPGHALRQLFPGHRPVRAAGGRLLLDLPVLPRRDGRAADHARPGPHDVGAPAAPGHRPVGREEHVDRENHGFVNLDSHPDYLIEQDRLDLYDQFLGWLTKQEGGWHALPREVASWWKDRAQMETDGLAVTGADDWDATVAHAREAGDRVVYDV